MPEVSETFAPAAGIMVLDKPLNLTSMTAVTHIRRRAGGIKTGHAGTLDPLATGVLVIALGRATKMIDQIMATDKRYITEIDLSAFTATDDAEAERQEVNVIQPPSELMILNAIASFVGQIMQRPPQFSAVKVGGRRAYKAARRGERVDLPERLVHVHSIDLVRCLWPIVELEIHCGKGVYVRSLARDLGVILHTGGYCRSIRRTAVGPFTLDLATRLEDLPERITQENLISQNRVLELLQSPK